MGSLWVQLPPSRADVGSCRVQIPARTGFKENYMGAYMQVVGKTDEWATPQWLFEQLDAEFHFTLDPCSTDQNAKCRKHYTKEQDGLAQDWSGETVFCNPPYGREMTRWIQKCAESAGGVLRLCFSFLRGQTPRLFTSISTEKQRSGSLKEDCDSGMLQRTHHSQA